MTPAPLPPGERERLAALERLGIMDTGSEQVFEDIVQLAATICGTPMALVSLVDARRQWFKARLGIDVPETPRDVAFCAHAILGDELLVVPDAALDPRFRDNRLVTTAPKLRFYAGAVLKTADGHRLGTLCVLDRRPRELTVEQTSALEVLARAVTAQLELRWSQRVLVERENALSAANAELQRSARMKDEFLASMSHELRTPLNSILGMSEALRIGALGVLEGRQVEAIGMIEESGRDLLQLINDILDLSKIEGGKMELSEVDVDPAAFAAACLRLFQEAAHRKGLRLSSGIDPELGPVRADPLRLKQIVVNLVSNAVKFTPKAGSVRVEMAADSVEGGLRIAVEDSGIGIAREDLNRVFEPFFQAESGLTREHGGTGLGLALVRRLAALHGGSVEVWSEVGKGSRFTVRIPGMLRRDASAPPVQQGPPPGSPGGAGVARGTGSVGRDRLVLLAEDNAVNVRIIGGFLESIGYRIAVARNGQEALDRVAAERPLLALVDIQMPVLDGLEAIRRLRARPDSARIPIVALTALAMPGDRERCIEAGADAYLSKPVSLRELAALVEELLSVDRNDAT